MASPAQLPAQLPIDEQQPQPGEDDAVALFGEGLKKLVMEDIRTDLDPEKVYQLSDIRKFEYYWRGIQFLKKTITGGQVDWTPLQNNSQAKDQNQNEDLYSYYANDIRGYGRKFIGVIAQQPPNVKFEPNKETSEDHIRRARKAQSVADILRNLWDIKWLSQQAAFGFWKSGTQFIHTPFVADADRYGTTEEPVMADQQIQMDPAKLNCVNCGKQTSLEGKDIPPQHCIKCGQEFGPEDFIEPETVAFPMPTGETTKYPNGCAEAHLYNGMYVSTPFWIRHLKDTPYLMLEYEEYKGKILAAYRSKPEIYRKLREMIDSGDSEGGSGYALTMARTTRDLAQSPSGTVILPHPNRWLYSQIWMRPSEYELAKGETRDGEMLRDALMQKFPDGLKLIMVQDKVVSIEASILDYEWTMAQPEAAENAYPDPICKDMISSQDLTNTCLNITAETLERQIPQTMIDVDVVDLTARRKNQLPASYFPVRRKGPGKLDDAVARMSVAKTEPEMTEYPTLLREHAAEGVGITRAIFGAGEKEQTAYATNLKRNQAMLQLGPALDALRSLIAGAEQNGVRQMAMHSGGTIPSPYSPRTETEQIDGIEELMEGGWHAEPEDTLPQSWSEKRVALMELMEKNPAALQSLGFADISNIPTIQDVLVGLPEWKVPNSDALGKVNNEIRELLKSAPTQQPSQMNPGMTVDIPSVPIDEMDDHDFVASALQEWFQTEDAQQEHKKNPQGWANVSAFWKAQKGLALPPPPPVGPGGATGAPGAPPTANSGTGPPSGPPPAPRPAGGQAPMAPVGGAPQGPPKLQPPAGGQAAGPPKPGAP